MELRDIDLTKPFSMGIVSVAGVGAGYRLFTDMGVDVSGIVNMKFTQKPGDFGQLEIEFFSENKPNSAETDTATFELKTCYMVVVNTETNVEKFKTDKEG